MSAKCLTTISYNSESFLIGQLNELKKSHIIAEWMYIFHHGEEDPETGLNDKDHLHVILILGNRRIRDVEDLRDMFREFDPLHPNKPLGCMPFQSGNLYDWLMYSVHEPTYLAGKGEVKEFTYRRDDIACSDEDYRNYEFRRAFDKLVTSKRVRYQTAEQIGYVKAVQLGCLNSSDISALCGAIRMDSYSNEVKRIHQYDERQLEYKRHCDDVNTNREEVGLKPIDFTCINMEVEND